MREIAGFILIFALITLAFKAAVMLLILAGLLFRTMQTIALLLLGGVLTGFSTYPLAATAIMAILLVVSLCLKRSAQH